MKKPGDRDDTENNILLGTHRNLESSFGFEYKSGPEINMIKMSRFRKILLISQLQFYTS